MIGKNILITGCAGFIGSNLVNHLLNKGYRVFGIDNFDPFYGRKIKERNISEFTQHKNFHFSKLDIADSHSLNKYFSSIVDIDMVIHLAGKAGVRPSIEFPSEYIKANVIATHNILENMRKNDTTKLIFASSSSVYGNSKQMPFRELTNIPNPISPYAATKKSCELINHTYHYLYGIDILNLRFFTVYGPKQRPDLAIHKFTNMMKHGQEITMFGDGTTARDYTYIDDTLSGIEASVEYLLKNSGVFEIVNLGNNHPVKLTDMINIIGEEAGVTPIVKRLPMQPGDVDITYADISTAKKLLNYNPQVKFRDGIRKFISWYDKVNN